MTIRMNNRTSRWWIQPRWNPHIPHIPHPAHMEWWNFIGPLLFDRSGPRASHGSTACQQMVPKVACISFVLLRPYSPFTSWATWYAHPDYTWQRMLHVCQKGPILIWYIWATFSILQDQDGWNEWTWDPKKQAWIRIAGKNHVQKGKMAGTLVSVVTTWFNGRLTYARCRAGGSWQQWALIEWWLATGVIRWGGGRMEQTC